jgi:hypothetical protein
MLVSERSACALPARRDASVPGTTSAWYDSRPRSICIKIHKDKYSARILTYIVRGWQRWPTKAGGRRTMPLRIVCVFQGDPGGRRRGLQVSEREGSFAWSTRTSGGIGSMNGVRSANSTSNYPVSRPLPNPLATSPVIEWSLLAPCLWNRSDVGVSWRYNIGDSRIGGSR